MNKSEVIALIRSVLSSTTASPTVASLNNDFKKETGMDIPLFGYQKLNDFLNSIPDTVKVTGSYPFQRVSLISNEKSAHIVSLVKRQKSNNLQKASFVKKKPFSFEPKTMVKKFQPDVSDSKLYNKTPVTAVSNIKKESFMPYFDNFKDPKAKSFVAQGNAANKSELKIAGPLAFVEVGCPLFEFMVVNETIPIINVRLHARINEYIEVRPCRIKNPHMFFFHFRKFKNIFKVLVKKLNKFYLANGKEIPALPERLVKPGQLCVVPYKMKDISLWSRAEIIKVTNKSLVVVYLVDYGNATVIHKNCLKIFHKGFLSVPKQAVQGYLANIKPLAGDSKWSVKATRRFSYLAIGNDLIGGVVDIDTSVNNGGGRIGLALSETKGAEIHINDTLVDEGYAEFDFREEESSKDWCEVPYKKTNHIESFIENLIEKNNRKYLKSGSLRPRKLSPERTQIFYFSSICNENERLKKLFSVAAKN